MEDTTTNAIREATLTESWRMVMLVRKEWQLDVLEIPLIVCANNTDVGDSVSNMEKIHITDQLQRRNLDFTGW